MPPAIQAIEKGSVHRITAGQVVVDLQTAVKELVENSIDAGATSIEVRFKDYGLKSIEVVDNGTGISPNDYDSVALKHHTSKLATYTDLTALQTFGFRGEALSSLCALCDSVVITSATNEDAPVGTILELDRNGIVKNRSGKIARQRGTTVTVSGIFVPLPVRRVELSRNIKREYGKALALLNAYALYPCAMENNGIRLAVYNQPEGGKRTIQLRTTGTQSLQTSVSSLWGPKALENIVPLELNMTVEPDKSILKRVPGASKMQVKVTGLVSKFRHGCGRASNDRQFFYVNGRPFNANKVQKALNEVYKSFNTNQSPFVIANFVLPTDAYDVNASPDKRTIFLHSEANLIMAFKTSLEDEYSLSRSTFAVNGPGGVSQATPQTKTIRGASSKRIRRPSFSSDEEDNQNANTDESGKDVGGTTTVDEDDNDEDARSRKSDLSPPDEELSPSPSPLSLTTRGTSPTSQRVPGSSGQSPRTPVTSSDTPVSTGKSSTGLSKNDPIPIPTHDDEISEQVRSDGGSDHSDSQPKKNKRKRSPSPTVSTIRPASDNSPTSRALAPKSLASPTIPELAAPTIPKDKSPSKLPVIKNVSALTSVRTSTNRTGAANKRVKLPTRVTTTGKSSQLSLRESLGKFARAGAAVAQPPVEEDELSDGEEEGMQIPARDTPLIGGRHAPISEPGNPQIGGAGSPIILDDGGTNDISNEIVGLPPPVRMEVLKRNDSDQVRCTLHFDQTHMSSFWRSRAIDRSHAPVSPSTPVSAPREGAIVAKEAGLTNTQDVDAGAKALSRVISKDDFKEGGMHVIGQFNLGFIIARLHRGLPPKTSEKDVTDDLFIIDQHAADEKYNFETLQETTQIQCQSLLRPRPLELTAADEITAIENLGVLQSNGFEISVDEDATVGRRLHLIAQPESKGTVFDMQDLEELLSLMHDQPPGHMVRCSKARNMFASRACRKSIMIGKALTSGQMTGVIRHMGMTDQPWSCPHGRPTMRHLVSLREVDALKKFKRQEIQWKEFGELLGLTR
ncbi:hypothetical protein BS47DRAFT_1336722 [Hydnum rufescens UP504]|uniref:DNA mismatch repair protein PMS1 n=1 Tax=Hydnum rufescens UP504 TaxID=1448309 RepID=A0A9P6DZL0_9AGAM|nr:hypothetical protein BS47DRAFT_1336722 [Hydnum rufescens UP504]